MSVESNVEASQKEAKHGLAWFLSLKAIWKLSVLELLIYLLIGTAAVIKFIISS